MFLTPLPSWEGSGEGALLRSLLGAAWRDVLFSRTMKTPHLKAQIDLSDRLQTAPVVF